MGCRQGRSGEYGDEGAACGAAAGSSPKAATGAPARLQTPSDDVLPWAIGIGGGRLAVSGVEGMVYVYDAGRSRLVGNFQAHKKTVNRVLPLSDNRLLTASADATVRLWQVGVNGTPAGTADSGSDPEPSLCLQGHKMSVSALDVLGQGESGPANGGEVLFTGSRDCTVRLWDLATGSELQQHKILRNVVTAVRRVPGQASVVVQASEDLQLRLWDARAGLSPQHAVRAGPNQLICLDVSSDGAYVACGSKGFSRENCEVQVFDLRAGLRQLCAAPCADQTIEALRMVGPDRCVIAGKDGYIRSVALPEVRVLHERGPAAAGYTALGIEHRSDGTPVVLAASAGPSGPGLELLTWPDATLAEAPSLLASTGGGR